MNRLVRAVLPTVVLAGLVVALPASAGADTTHSVPLSRFSHILVDDAHGHVFLTGGGSDGVAVRDLNGNAVTAIKNEPGANGLALSPDASTLYVALSTADAIAAISTSTFLETARYSTGASTCPATLATLGTNIWFGTSCQSGTDGVGVVDLSQNPAVVTLNRAAGLYQPDVVSSPQLASRIFVGEFGLSPATVRAYDVSGTTLTAGPSAQVGSNLRDLAITPDGVDLVIAAGSPYYHQVFKTSDLSGDGQYGTNNPYPQAVAVGADGFVAAGLNASYSPDVYVYRHDGTLMSKYDFGTCCNVGDSTTLAPGGLAFVADLSRLYAVTTDYLGGTVRLHVLCKSTIPPSALALSGPGSVRRATALSITGRLTALGSVIGSAPLKVTKADLDGNHTIDVGLRTGADGRFTIHDTPAVGGTNTYTVTYKGDATHRSVRKSIKVSVSRTTPTLVLKTDHATYGYDRLATVTAHLGTTFSNRTVSLYAQPSGRSRKLLKTAKVNTHGNLSATVTVTRETTFTVTFGGDERRSPRTVSARVGVHAKVQTAVAGVKRTDGKYRVYGATKGGAIAIKVTPNKAGERVRFVLQAYSGGAWRTVDSVYRNLDSASVYGVGFRGETAHRYRIRGSYLGDAVNLAETGSWQYARFV